MKPTFVGMRRIVKMRRLAISLCAPAMLAWTPGVAQDLSTAGQQQPAPQQSPSEARAGESSAPKEMSGMDMGPKPAPKDAVKQDKGAKPMGAMQGGRAPPGARDPNAYADGYDYGSIPGLDQADRIGVNKLLVDQLEFVQNHAGQGIAWDIHDFYGADFQKLLVRTEGAVINGNVDFTTGIEALWWHAVSPFWGTALGVHQDVGTGSHTSLAFGIEGLSPYWFELEATGYVAEDGRMSARLKGSYDLLLTNRLILTPEAESMSSAGPIRDGASVRE